MNFRMIHEQLNKEIHCLKDNQNRFNAYMCTLYTFINAYARLGCHNLCFPPMRKTEEAMYLVCIFVFISLIVPFAQH